MNREAELLITDISSKGDGVGHHNGLRIEIPHTLPGDTVKSSFGRKRKGSAKGRLLELVTPSSLRSEPQCPHSRICGGCHFHEMLYSHQLAHKQKVIQDLFTPFSEKISPIVPSDPYWNYRNKMEFSFSENRAKTAFLGLMIARAQSCVFNVEYCHLAPPWFSSVLLAVRKFWQESGIPAFYPPKNEGVLRNLTCREGRRSGEKMVILTVSEELSAKHSADLVSSICKVIDPTSLFLRVQKTQRGVPTQFIDILLYGKPYIQEKMLYQERTFSFRLSPSSFFQPNTLQAEKLYSLALSMAAPSLDMVVYDLYCGTGTLGMFFSPFVKKVYGIESNPDAVANGRENLIDNHITNVSLHTGLVEDILATLPEKPDLVIVDPPRCGLDPKTISYLQQLQAKKIVYISCHPRTQARDIESLSSYRPSKIQPVDQFPHTVHIENIVLLDLIF